MYYFHCTKRGLSNMYETINPYEDVICIQTYAPLPNCVLRSVDLSDAEKLLLARLYQYSGKKGTAHPYRKTLANELGWSLEKLKRVIALLKEKELVVTEKKSQNSPRVYVFLKHEVYEGKPFINRERKPEKVMQGGVTPEPTGEGIFDHTIYENISGKTKGVAEATTSPLRGHDSNTDKINNLAPSKRRASVKQKKEISDVTLGLVKYWNTFDSLTTHNLAISEGIVFYHEQTKTIQRVDTAIQKLLRGTYYTNCADLKPALRTKNYSVGEIKKAIERMALACTAEYTRTPKRVSFVQFLENQHAKLLTGNNQYRYKFPLVHFIYNAPSKLEDTRSKKHTEYEILVNRVIAKLVDNSIVGTKYNQVVTQVEKAVAFIDANANGNRMELRRQLPELIYDSLLDVGKGATVDALPLGVWNLERMMKQRMIL